MTSHAIPVSVIETVDDFPAGIIVAAGTVPWFEVRTRYIR